MRASFAFTLFVTLAGLLPLNAAALAKKLKVFIHNPETMKIVLLLFSVTAALQAAPLSCDLTQYRGQGGLEARLQNDTLVVQWEGESGQQLRATFSIVDGVPRVDELAVQKSA